MRACQLPALPPVSGSTLLAHFELTVEDEEGMTIGRLLSTEAIYGVCWQCGVVFAVRPVPLPLRWPSSVFAA